MLYLMLVFGNDNNNYTVSQKKHPRHLTVTWKPIIRFW